MRSPRWKACDYLDARVGITLLHEFLFRRVLEDYEDPDNLKAMAQEWIDKL